MLQIKIVQGKSLDDLTNKVNEFLISIKTATNITVDSTNLTAVIQHEIDEEWKNQICADCRYWDCGNSSDALIGTCQMCGLRKRFNNTACDKFNDVRG